MTGTRYRQLTLVGSLLGLVLFLGVAAPAALQNRPLAIEDYYRMSSVGGVAISPDAQWVTFSVSRRVEEDNGTVSETFVVAASGAGEPRRLEHGGQPVSGVAWMPDSRLSYRTDGQSWSVDPADASASPIRVLGTVGRGGPGRGGRGGGRRGGGGGPIASPDGSATIELRVRQMPPDDVPAMTEFERRHDERFEGAIFDWMQFQRDGQAFPAPDPTAGPGRQIVARIDGNERVILDEDLRPSNVAWHPDNRRFAFTADEDWRNERTYGRADLWVATVDGDVMRLTDDLYVYGNVRFSPDGAYLSYVRSFGTDMVIQERLNHGGSRDVFVRPVGGGDPVNLTASWDLDPGTPRWAPDGRFVYFTATTGGESHLFRVSASGGGVEQMTSGPRRLGGLSIDPSFTWMAYTVAVHDEPGDVYVSRIDGTDEQRLTNIHREFLAEVALGKADRLEWESYDGTPIEGWLTYPHGYDPAAGPYPMIVFSHGGPHSATGYRFDFKQQFFAASGYFILDTNFRSSTGYGDDFKWATWGAWGDKDGQDVVSGIDHVLEQYPVDRNRVGHTGHSYGGFMTNWLITQYPDRFAAAISGAGISNWVSDYGTADIFRTKETEFFGTPWEEEAQARMMRQSPLTYAGQVQTPTLFVHGEVDQRVPYTEAEQMYFALKRIGVPAKVIQYAGMPHGIRGHWNNVHRMLNELQWWETYLKNGAQ